MDVLGRFASPLEWHSEFSPYLSKENFLFWYLISGVLVHGAALVYLSLDQMSCGATEISIPQQFQEGVPELRDLSAYVDIICTTDIKARHCYAFFVSVGIIAALFLYGVALKSNLASIKRAYFMYYQKYLAEFKERVIRRGDIDHTRLRRKISRQLWYYIFFKVVCSLVLLGITAALITIKYAIEGARELFLPYETTCGPTLWWDEVRGEEFDIGIYYCHFENEWTTFVLMALVDLYSLGLVFVLGYHLVLALPVVCCSILCNKRDRIVDLRVTKTAAGDFRPIDKNWEPMDLSPHDSLDDFNRHVQGASEESV